jgi:thiamine-phosphate diphosphorylase
LQGADYLTFGHVYETSSHPAHAPRGLDLLASIAKVAPIPVIAIGGITPKRVPEILATGALGIAVMSGILQAAEPAVAAQTFRAALDEPGGTSTV